tara:strand:- start:1260 stop:1688 length:429 start_codon:yes stop_codon:yes gene_type:complete
MNPYGWNSYYGWNNGYRSGDVAYHNGRRGSTMSIQDRIGNAAMIETSKRKNLVIETDIDKEVIKLKRNNNNIRVYNNPNNPNINNNSKPRVYVRPNNNSINNNPPRIYTRPSVNNSSTTTNSSSNVSRGSNNSRGGKPNGKN